LVREAFLPREAFVSEIKHGDGQTLNLFYRGMQLNKVLAKHSLGVGISVRPPKWIVRMRVTWLIIQYAKNSDLNKIEVYFSATGITLFLCSVIFSSLLKPIPKVFMVQNGIS
jgi:hypothetical protein